jgi:hypothetical protein
MTFQMNHKLCPYVKHPLNDCYCFNLNSRNISPAIHYCSNHYMSCEIFKKEFIQERTYEGNIQSK